MACMHDLECDRNDRRWLRTPGTHRQAIITLAEDIHTLKNRGSTIEALRVEHDAIEAVLRSLWQAVLACKSRVEVIEILNIAIDFCATHFADEEEFMRKSGCSHLEVHAAAHKHLLAKIVAARRSASGEGLSLAVLDAADLLHDFHEHVKTYDRHHAETLASA
jgi:hemerythrin-like metal-binding protein